MTSKTIVYSLCPTCHHDYDEAACPYCETRRIYRQKWVTVLETTEDNQVFGKMCAGMHEYCPIGLAVRYVIWESNFLGQWPVEPKQIAEKCRMLQEMAGVSSLQEALLGLDISLTAADIDYLKLHCGPALEGTIDRGEAIVRMNDQAKWSFKQIAKAMRELGWDQ